MLFTSIAHNAAPGKLPAQIPPATYDVLTDLWQRCTCGHCDRYIKAGPEGEVTVWEATDNFGVTAWLPDEFAIVRVKPEPDGTLPEGKGCIYARATNGARVRFEQGELVVRDQWGDWLSIHLPDDVRLMRVGGQGGGT